MFCGNAFADKDKVLDGIDKLSRNYDYHFFAHSTSGEEFWGSTINRSAFLQLGYAKSTKDYECSLKSFQSNSEAPYKGTWNLKCATFNAEGSWVQECLTCNGIGTGYSDNGNVVSAYFSKNRMKIWGVAKNYFDGQNKKIVQKPKNSIINFDCKNSPDRGTHEFVKISLDKNNKKIKIHYKWNDEYYDKWIGKRIDKNTPRENERIVKVNSINNLMASYSSSTGKYQYKFYYGGSKIIENTTLNRKTHNCKKINNIEIAEKPKKQVPKKQKPDPDDKIVPAGSGSGFFVSKDGTVITNYHVIEGCQLNKVSYKGNQIEAKTLSIDKVNDIAILKTDINPETAFSVSNEDVSLLEDVVVAGYPLGKQISSAIKTHKGVVTALAGAGDNYSYFQTDAAINQGNSGGPIINQKGNVVGIAVQTWVEEGVQGVHFGIKSSTLKTFANANGLKFLVPNNKDLSNKELGRLITESTVYVECHMTIAKIKKMIAQAENKKAFFKKYQ
jgi:hypothetical protein